MKKFAAVLFLFSAMCVSAFAQSLSAEVDKIRQIKLLESTRADVQKILNGYQAKYNDAEFSETFSSAKMEIEVTYANGVCSDDLKMWNVENGKADFISVTFKDSVKFEDLNYSASVFRKERLVTGGKVGFIYHDKDAGIAFVVEQEKITLILLFPQKTQSSLLCNNEKSTILREFYSRKTYIP